MYDAEYTRKFYDAYGEAEWQRLEATAFGKLQAVILEDTLKAYVKPGDQVLDAGSGPGRFSIAAAKAGATVTVLDISNKQLELAMQKITEAGQLDHIDRFFKADICDLSIFADGQFDVVISFGGALSYVCEKRQQAADELIRVVKPGGTVIVSVMSRLGLGLGQLPEIYIRKLQNAHRDLPGSPALWKVIETGDLAGFPSPRAGMMHAAMHLYTAEEISNLFRNCMIVEMAASNVTLREYAQGFENIVTDPAAWPALIEMEKKLNHEPGLLDTGSHIIMAVAKYP
jgi:ubiquinone/menaquinone biosynthesis C-methylase UbiE